MGFNPTFSPRVMKRDAVGKQDVLVMIPLDFKLLFFCQSGAIKPASGFTLNVDIYELLKASHVELNI